LASTEETKNNATTATVKQEHKDTTRHTHKLNRFTALLDFVRDYPGEPAPEM